MSSSLYHLDRLLHATSPMAFHSLTAVIAAIVLAVGIYAYRALKALRAQYPDVATFPPSLLFGNILNMGKFMDPSRHSDYGIEKIWHLLGQPPCFKLDMRPIASCYIVVADPALAEEITRSSARHPYSLRKADGLRNHAQLVGRTSILLLEGEDWKEMRKRFNPGFQPRHLYTLTPLLLTKTRIFLSKLHEASASGAVIPLDDLTHDLTVDIIGEVAMEHDFQAQLSPEGSGAKGPTGILTCYRKILDWMYYEEKSIYPWHRFNFLRPLVVGYYEKKLDAQLATLVKRAVASPTTSTRSIVNLATRAALPLSPTLLTQTVDQLKTFIFAGEDTTATLMAWTFYRLSRAPECLARLRAEHDRVFGPNSSVDAVADLLRTDTERCVSDLTYTAAVLKEALRLNPPAATVRKAPAAGFDAADSTGRTFELGDALFYIPHYLIHRNPRVWGADAHIFRPERWLEPGALGVGAVGGFRPFERGPRNCIGQELAQLEARVILCLTARWFDFEKVGMDGVGEEEVFDIYALTHRPCDRMMMRVRYLGDGGAEKAAVNGDAAANGLKI